ncbi:MAG: hypothetical protein FWE82_10665 [Defluviitaleaceae bacterium]|nr:hypothetical protein [Defluviitaleaceae bacterium]
MEKIKNYLIIILFVLLLGGGLLLNIILPHPDILASERRKPASMPNFSADSVFSSQFMDGFGKYATDNFIFRDSFRSMHAFSVFYLFRQTDNAGLYRDRNVGAGRFEKINEPSLRRVTQKINLLAQKFQGANIYFSFVPDKSVYASRYFPGFLPETARLIVNEDLLGINVVDLSNAVDADTFYRTDLHWDQSKLSGVLLTLGAAMNINVAGGANFFVNSAGSFNGVYSGQLSLPMPPDTLLYMTNEHIDSASVFYFDPAKDGWVGGPVYDIDAAKGRDPYDLFLCGVQALIKIYNPSADTNRSLYLIRDSFGSSLAPLLIQYYSEITVIDMRYIDSRILNDYIEIEIENADVLFLYSSQILNKADDLLIH